MSAQTTSETPFFVRRADPDDVDTICAMFDHTFGDEVALDSFASFHNIDMQLLKAQKTKQKFFVSLIETCFMSVTVEDEDSNIVGFAALDDCPIQMLQHADAGTMWEDWFRSVYDEPGVSGTSALWFSCCLSEAEPGVVGEILRATFSTMHDLQHLLAFVPAGLTEDDASLLLQPFESHFVELEPVADPLLDETHWAGSPDATRASVLTCRRSKVITPLRIRMARVEDHDNLAAVFDAQSEVVTEIYGEYFIAELIEAQNDENKALVAEVDGRAVGLMCLTSDVDTNVLSQCFQLDPYDNLLKPEYMKRVRDYASAVFAGQTDASLCCLGDYMQVALASIDLPALLDAVPHQEEGGRFTAVQLHGQLQLQEFTDEVGEAVQDFEHRMMTLLWQSNFLERRHEADTLIEPEGVLECVRIFMSLDANERRGIAAAVLDRWDDVQEVFRATREAAAAQLQAEAEAEEGAEQESDVAVETVVFLKALSTDQDGPFTMDFLVKLLMALHWWANEDISGPVSSVPDDGFRSALERLSTSEEGLFVEHPNSPTWLSNLPHHAKDVFCVNMCCLDQAFQTQALDFLLPAFSLYPDKDYCIITQPHTASNTPLLNAFTIVPPQPQNTFGHVLYLIHRASLLGPPVVRALVQPDLDALPSLTNNFDDDMQNDIFAVCEGFLTHHEKSVSVGSASEQAKELSVFVAEFDEQVVGLIVLELPPPDTVSTLRCCYHLDDYLLVEHHENGSNKGHTRLVHYVINPLFQKFTRRVLQAAMRALGRTVLFAEMDLQSTVPPIFRELLQVMPRRPPQLKKVLRKPPKVASFVNVEKEIPTEDDLREQERQELLRDSARTNALSIVAKKLLSETKIPVNARIVVVGASDCGLSFLESLLSIPHLLFNSLTLLAPGGLEYHHSHHLPLVAGSAAYSHNELRRIMLELRVRILDSRMVQIDRQQRCCVLHDGSMLPYDYLIVGAGLQDDALHSLRIRSWGVEHVTDGYRSVNGCMSAADPSIRDLLVEGGTLVKSLIWNPLSYAVVYGRSLHAYCVVQGLLMRKVPPTKIILVLPPRLQDDSQQLSVDAFYAGDEVEIKIHNILKSMDMKVYEGYSLLGIQQDNRQRLKALILEDHTNEIAFYKSSAEDAGAKAEAGAAPKSGKVRCGIMEDFGVSPNNLRQKLLACRILITADAVNVDPDIFNSVHGNGLVYDGRLIVDHNFKTTDDAIFGAGSLCEFSRRFKRKNAERYLRHDGYNGREVGSKLSQALLRVLDPVNGDVVAAGGSARGGAAGGAASPTEGGAAAGGAAAPTPQAAAAGGDPFEGLDGGAASPDMLPDFYMPIAKGGFLPGNLHYYRIHSCKRAGPLANEGEPREDRVIVTDTLEANGKGHFCRLTIDVFGKVDSITYLGGEELQVESLWSLVGLSETFLNHLFVRWEGGDIPDIVEFLTDEWATALFHDRFMDFCLQIQLEMRSQDEVKAIIDRALETVNLKEGLSRKLLASIQLQLPKSSIKAMQEHLLEYLRENTNHLKTYFLPDN